MNCSELQYGGDGFIFNKFSRKLAFYLMQTTALVSILTLFPFFVRPVSWIVQSAVKGCYETS